MKGKGKIVHSSTT